MTPDEQDKKALYWCVACDRAVYSTEGSWPHSRENHVLIALTPGMQKALTRATPADEQAVEALIARLENFYDFECEGGPLKNCLEWQQLKAALLVERRQPAQDVEQTIAALKWADNMLSMFVTEDDGSGVFIWHSHGTELAGFGAGRERLRDAIKAFGKRRSRRWIVGDDDLYPSRPVLFRVASQSGAPGEGAK